MPRMNKIIVAFFLLASSFVAMAQTTSTFGTFSRQELPPSYIKMLVWNIHAGKDELFARDFSELSRGQHLVVLQEADLSNDLKDSLLPNDFFYTHARSYISPISKKIKGIATGSVSRPSTTRALRSPVSEFGVATPKAVLLQTFKIAKRKKQLLVVNVHAINFVTNEMFRAHINQIIKAIKAHKGPIVAAGDFNTWNEGRLKDLDVAMYSQGLSRVSLGIGRSQFPNLGRWFGVQTGGPFDQIYARGIEIRFKEVHAGINSSDHKPMEMHFSINE